MNGSGFISRLVLISCLLSAYGLALAQSSEGRKDQGGTAPRQAAPSDSPGLKVEPSSSPPGSYRDMGNGMRQYDDPASQMRYEAWLRQEAERKARQSQTPEIGHAPRQPLGLLQRPVTAWNDAPVSSPVRQPEVHFTPAAHRPTGASDEGIQMDIEPAKTPSGRSSYRATPSHYGQMGGAPRR